MPINEGNLTCSVTKALPTSHTDIDGTPVNFNNKKTAISYDDLHLLILHPLPRGEVVSTTRDTVLCIFNYIFTGGELLCISLDRTYLSCIGKPR